MLSTNLVLGTKVQYRVPSVWQDLLCNTRGQQDLHQGSDTDCDHLGLKEIWIKWKISWKQFVNIMICFILNENRCAFYLGTGYVDVEFECSTPDIFYHF